MILIIGSDEDAHAKTILDRILRVGREGIILNFEEFPSKIQIAFTKDGGNENIFVYTKETHMKDCVANAWEKTKNKR